MRISLWEKSGEYVIIPYFAGQDATEDNFFLDDAEFGDDGDSLNNGSDDDFHFDADELFRDFEEGDDDDDFSPLKPLRPLRDTNRE